ncbi:MAG: GvpL/GvpF family gas vesicle protein [Bacteroidota bacterium]
MDKLKPQAIEYKVQKNITDAMFANVAFFVHRSDEKQFDEYVNELSDELGDNITFKYVGPIAPVNFI